MANRTQHTGPNNTISHKEVIRNWLPGISPPERILGLDLGGKTTGYAIFQRDHLLEPGRIVAPSRWPAIWRARHIAEALPELLAKANTVFLEVPSHKRFGAERAGLRAGLGVYGMACGLLVAKILEICADIPRLSAWAIPAHWPAGKLKNKAQRARAVKTLYRGWNWEVGGGEDAIDAVCLVYHSIRCLKMGTLDGLQIGAGNDYRPGYSSAEISAKAAK